MGLSRLVLTLFELQIPRIKALSIGCRPVQLLARYLQWHGLHGQEQQGGPNVPQHCDQDAVGHGFRLILADITIILLDTSSQQVWRH